MRFGGYDHGNGYDHDCCGSTTTAIKMLAMVTIAAAMAMTAELTGAFDRFPVVLASLRLQSNREDNYNQVSVR